MGFSKLFFFFKSLNHFKSYQISTCITNRVWYGFGAPQIKKILFGPLYSPWKIINIDLLGGSNRRLLIFLQYFQPTGLNGWAIFKIYGEIVVYNTNYAFDGWIIRAPAFFCRFLIKKIKRHARAKNDVGFFFIYFARTSAPTVDRRKKLQTHFLIHVLNCN